MTTTHTRTHVTIGFADPYLKCDDCGQPVPRWHDDAHCGCGAGCWNEPCEHRAGVTTVCPSWGPVNGCRCQESLGYVPHAGPYKRSERAAAWGQPGAYVGGS